MTMLKIGWKAGIEQHQPDTLLTLAVTAEQAGFQSIDVSDHFHPWSEDGSCGFTWTWLGAAASQTKTIELGTGLTCPILRYHPAIIAQAAATVAYMAPERFYLGVGTGEALNEYSATGFWPGYSERQAMLRESIDLMRQLWTGQETSFSGEYYETKKATLYTLPKKHIPIYISTMVPNSAFFAGEFGDGMITVGGQKPEIYKEMLKNFGQGAKKAGRDPKQMPKLIEINAAYTDNADEAVEVMKKYWAGTFIIALFDQKIYTPKMSAQNGEVVGADVIKQKTMISKNPKDQLANIQQYIDLGFTHIYVHFAAQDEGAMIREFGKDVLPKIKGS
jgi:coenzyme F420-dependent glucose-6-phosphate dehydrogenase